MNYLVVGDAPAGVLQAAALATGEMLVLEGPWPLGATCLACVPDEAATAAAREQLARYPQAAAYAVEGLAEPGVGEAFAIAAHRIDDPARFRDYAARVPAVVAAFGGRFLARGGTVTPLAGAFAPERAVIIEFPTAAAAVAFYGSDLYAPLLRLRLETTDPRFAILARYGALPEAVHAAAKAHLRV